MACERGSYAAGQGYHLSTLLYLFVFFLSISLCQASLYTAATNLRVAESREWWRNVHGFDMGSVSLASLKEVDVCKLSDHDIVSPPCLLSEISLYNCER